MKTFKAMAAATAISAAAVLLPASANAASITGGYFPVDANGAFFGVATSAGAINDTFSVQVTQPSNIDVSLMYFSGAANSISSLAATFNGSPIALTLNNGVYSGSLAKVLGAGTYTINVLGSASAPGANYSGTINVSAAVPEPATWAMMILGIGGIGMVARRRRGAVASVRFA